MSIFDHPDLVPAAPSWRCPHCRTLQPEAARCRSCARAAVSCATCHRFRRSIAGDLGFCADDRTRSPLSGEEVQPCWEAAPTPTVAAGLFDDDELAEQPAAAAPPTAQLSGSTRPIAHPPPAPSPPAASGGLVDAPHVPPARRLMSEFERRARGGGG